MYTENYSQNSETITDSSSEESRYPKRVRLEISSAAAKRIIKLLNVTKEHGLKMLEAHALEIGVRWLDEQNEPYSSEYTYFVSGTEHKSLFRPARTSLVVEYEYKEKAETIEDHFNVYITETELASLNIKMYGLVDIKKMAEHFGYNIFHEIENESAPHT